MIGGRSSADGNVIVVVVVLTTEAARRLSGGCGATVVAVRLGRQAAAVCNIDVMTC